MSKQVEVATLPDCNICTQHGKTVPAYADANLPQIGWIYVCKSHFTRFGGTLGTGRGQELILR